MNTPTHSAIASAIEVSVEARDAAISAGEFGAAFDLRVIGHLLADDKQVHEQIATNSETLATRLHEILADGKVTPSEQSDLGAIERELQLIGKLATPS